MKPIEQVRTILFEELDRFRKENADIQRARAVSELAAQTIYSIRVEVENKKIEFGISRANDSVKTWMDKDFTKISKE